MKSHRIFRQRGSSLILVLIVFAVFLVLGGAVLTYGTVSTYRTRAQTDDQQAYFIARSAVSATIRYIQKDDAVQRKIAALNQSDDTLTGTYAFPDRSVSGPDESVRITATQFSNGAPSALRVTAVAAQNGASASATAYLRGTAAASADSGSVYPFDNLIYVNSSAGAGQCNLTGNVASNGAFSYGSGSTINGMLLANGDVRLDGSGNGLTGVKTPGSVVITASGVITNGDVYAGGGVNMSGSGRVNGNVYAQQGMNISGSGTVTGNLYLHGDLNISSGSILGNALVQGNGTFSGGTIGTYGNSQTGNASFSGNVSITNWGVSFCNSLTYGGAFTIPKDSSWSNFVPNQPVRSTAPLNVPAVPPMPSFSATLPTSIPLPSVPGSESSPIRVSSLVASSTPLTHSGYISFDYNSGSATLTVDTGSTQSSANDINLIVSGSQTVAQPLNVQVTGVNRLFIYLKGDNTTLTIYHNFLMQGNYSSDGTVTPRIFIIGTGRNQQVSLASNSKVDAFIYLPQGKFSVGGGTDGRYNLFGSVCAETMDVNGGIYMRYAPPDLTGTPLEGLASGGAGSESGGSDTAAAWTWTLDGWADK